MLQITGDLTTCNADCIVQQCNCLSVYTHGLSKTIKDKLGVDPYGHRRKQTNNCAIKEDRDKVGTTKLFKDRRGKYVACMFAQYAPGMPDTYFRSITKGVDTRQSREVWFQMCLDDLARQLSEPQVVAFPHCIGCGLGGGDWKVYKQMIKKWAEKNKHLQVYIVKLKFLHEK